MENQEHEWYYRKADTQHGPVTKEVLCLLIGQGQLSLDDYVWRQGLSEWIKARNTIELYNPATAPPPFVAATSEQVIPDERKVGLKIAACLVFVSAILWTLIAIAQIASVIIDEETGLAFDAAWNVVWTIVAFAVGVGIWRQQTWALKWGQTTSIIGVIWYGVGYFTTGNAFTIFLVLIELAIFIVLFSNRKYFQ